MRTFQIAIFVIAVVVASTQTFRHVYVKWIEPTGSVLDQFNTEVEADIARAESLDELIPLFAEAHAKVLAYEADESNPLVELYQREAIEPYADEFKLRREIEDREHRRAQIFELCFYWVSGLISVLIGLWVYLKVNAWLGIAAVLTGFSEMLCWTSPLVHSRWAGQEFLTLLNYKLALSFCTWVLLVGLWLLVQRLDQRS